MWQALQVSHFLRSLGPVTEFHRQLTTLERCCNGVEPLPRALSKMYGFLNMPAEEFVMPGIRKWEKDLGRIFTPIQHKQIIYLAVNSSVCSKTQEANYKLLVQWYYTPERLHQFDKEVDERCWRCGREQGTLLHIFWYCQKIRHYWEEVRRISQKFSEVLLPDDPALFLLHSSEVPVQKYRKSVVCHMINAARAGVTSKWRDICPPSIAGWLKRIEEVGAMEDLVRTAQNRRIQYEEIWSGWNVFMRSEEGKVVIEGN